MNLGRERKAGRYSMAKLYCGLDRQSVIELEVNRLLILSGEACYVLVVVEFRFERHPLKLWVSKNGKTEVLRKEITLSRYHGSHFLLIKWVTHSCALLVQNLHISSVLIGMAITLSVVLS